ncbi:MAG: hypothetical protein NTX04_12775 [Verrucomicrobia bacterium]|nr:hypothetical protein [Verrucomicrobiota bacterium]
MKKFLVLTSMVILSMSSAFAACGKKVTSEGTLKSFDPATKALVVEAKDGKATTITLTPTTAGADAAAGLVGKSVKVVSEHGKADTRSGLLVFCDGAESFDQMAAFWGWGVVRS